MTEIGISKDKPEIYEKLHKQFNVEWDSGLIIADGKTIHCKFDIPPAKFIHELVHIKQQEKTGKSLWWELYLAKPEFRLEQEVEAYKAEYRFFSENVNDRNMRFDYLYEIARTLASEQYGKLCTGDEALRLIQQVV